MSPTADRGPAGQGMDEVESAFDIGAVVGKRGRTKLDLGLDLSWDLFDLGEERQLQVGKATEIKLNFKFVIRLGG